MGGMQCGSPAIGDYRLSQQPPFVVPSEHVSSFLGPPSGGLFCGQRLLSFPRSHGGSRLWRWPGEGITQAARQHRRALACKTGTSTRHLHPAPQNWDPVERVPSAPLAPIRGRDINVQTFPDTPRAARLSASRQTGWRHP